MKRTTLSELLSTMLSEFKKSLNTANIGRIVSFNPQTQRAQVQPSIQRVNVDKTIHEPPVINDVPVLMIGGTGGHVECQVNVGDEGFIVFMQRNIDGWKQQGGIAPNPTARFMDTQDCVFVMGVRSIAQMISDFQNNGIRIRYGDYHVWVKNDGTISIDNGNISSVWNPDGSHSTTNGAGVMTLQSDGTIILNGLTIPPMGQGSAVFDGTLSATDVTTQSGVSLEQHTHSGVQSGGGNTGEPNK